MGSMVFSDNSVVERPKLVDLPQYEFLAAIFEPINYTWEIVSFIVNRKRQIDKYTNFLTYTIKIQLATWPPMLLYLSFRPFMNALMLHMIFSLEHLPPFGILVKVSAKMITDRHADVYRLTLHLVHKPRNRVIPNGCPPLPTRHPSPDAGIFGGVLNDMYPSYGRTSGYRT